MRVVIDRYIPYVASVLEREVEVVVLDPEDITAEAVHEADALVVRTRTKVDATLLEGSRVQFVATATIGFDHIDQAYCAKNGIKWISCPGCNAQAVCNYIEECIQEVGLPKGKTIGVVGIGHVGTLVAQMAERRGYSVLRNDPPKSIGVSLGEIVEKCDLITFHTPLIKDGPYRTYHLCDENFLRCCKKEAFIINAARGGIVDENALLASGNPFILDTWENEPNISLEVLNCAVLASFHIAGYSVLGKLNASQMCLEAFSVHFGFSSLAIDKKVVSLQTEYGDSASGWLRRITEQLKSTPTEFESLRKQYKLR